MLRDGRPHAWHALGSPSFVSPQLPQIHIGWSTPVILAGSQDNGNFPGIQ
ncbi:hypothetical protein ACQP2E_07025 [Actinoplanes sp. CA-015351]